jgi:integrase
VHVVLRKAFKQAMLWGYMTRNPCDAVARPKPSRKAIRYFTAEETNRFLVVARGDRLNALYVLAVSAGLRQRELFGLKWRDVDWTAGAIAVQRTIDDLRGKLSVGEPKTAKGRRRVELPAIAMTALREHRKAMFAEGHASDWISATRRAVCCAAATCYAARTSHCSRLPSSRRSTSTACVTQPQHCYCCKVLTRR